VTVFSATATADEGNWASLFNGKNLNVWVVKCHPEDKDKIGYWKVVNGTITAETPSGSKHNYIWLLTEKEYGDFELRLRVQTYSTTTGNSGTQVRIRYDDAAGYLDGPQVDIHPPGPWRCGFIYDETREVKIWLWPNVGKPANAKPEHAPKDLKWLHADAQDIWNDVYIICKGTKIKTIIKDVPEECSPIIEYWMLMMAALNLQKYRNILPILGWALVFIGITAGYHGFRLGLPAWPFYGDLVICGVCGPGIVWLSRRV